MATQQYGGIAYITLDGNHIQWIAGRSHSKILLYGSHFHDIIPMTSLSISGLFFLSFLIIFVAFCQVTHHRVHKYQKQNQDKLLKDIPVITAILCMIFVFGFQITNRVEHEHERIIGPEFIVIDIPMNCLASIADGTLMIYLLKKSPVEIRRPNSPRQASHIAMIFAFAMYWVIGIASKGANIWNVITQFDPGSENGSCKTKQCQDESKGIDLSLRIEQDLDSAAVGMLLLFSLGYLLFAIGYVRRLPETHFFRKKLSLSVGTLAFTFVARNLVEFVITLFYSQFNHEASQGIQLLYLAFYGVLSAAVYTSVVFVEATRVKEGPYTQEPGFESAGRFGSDWQQKQPQVNVGEGRYPGMYPSHPGRYEDSRHVSSGKVERY